jgi:xylulokinase
VILAIDCGLSAVKLSIADREGQIVARERVAYPTVVRMGVAEQDPDEWWRAIATAAARLPQLEQVAVIVPTGHMHGLVLIDEDLQPLLPCFTLHDRRGADRLARLEPEAFREETGEVLDASLPLAKLLWLLDEQAALLRRAAAVLSPKDLVQARLTGRVATDPVDAAGTGLFNPRAGTWSMTLVDKLGLPSGLLPPVAAATELAPIRADAARELGLPPSVLVAVGAGDDIELLGATAHRPGTAVEHVGTTGGILRPLASGPQPITLPAIELYPTGVPGRFAAGASTVQAGAVFSWLRDALGVEASDVFSRDPSGREPVVTGGLFAERSDGPRPGPGASIHGLTAAHNRLDISRGLVVAATLTMRALLEQIEECTGPVETIYASGGAGGIEWTRWRAAAYGRPVTVLRDDPTARGCVALGLAAQAGRSDIEAVAAELPGDHTVVEPAPALAGILARLAVGTALRRP